MPEAQEYLTLDEVSQLLRVRPRTIHAWVQSGKLRAFKPGGHLLFKRSDACALVEQNVRVRQ